MAKVTVFSTKGRKRVVVETSAVVWGDLKKDLSAQDIPTSGFRAIIGETQTTLESAKAVLPKGLDIRGTITDDFTLFLTPIKVKSGGVIDVKSMGYKECKKFIKEQYASSDEAKAYFGNYTQATTDKMKTLIKGWLASNSEEVVEEGEDMTAEDYIDVISENLALLKEHLQTKTKEEVIDEVEVLQAQWEEIKSNL